jgi:hypothetical protein
MRIPRLLTVAAALLCLTGWAAAQPHAELIMGFGGYFPSWKDSSYTHAYSPRFLYGTPAVTSGLQTLSLSAASIAGGSVGAAAVFGHFGVSLTYLAFSPDVTGTTSSDAVSISYTSYPPPSYEPTPVTAAQAIPMADPSGELHERTVSLNGFYRVVLPSWFSLDLSAGLTWFAIDGEIGTLDYWKFWLGGHSVLFSQQYALVMSVDTLNRIGGNLGATLNVHIGTNAALWIEARYHLAAAGEAALSFSPVEDATALAEFDPETDIIPAGKLMIDPGFLRLGAGFRILF